MYGNIDGTLTNMLPMEEKYINLVNEAEDLFDKIIKESSFIQERILYQGYPFMQDDRKIVNVSLTNKT